MSRLMCVTGATGNQGGSVAKILLQHPETYQVRALTRNPDSAAAKELRELGAEICKADLNHESEVDAAFEGCWGVFAVTNSYDPAVIANPGLEEEQGRIMARAAKKAGVHCYLWSTLPSSLDFSNGEIDAFIYESKHRVDQYIIDLDLPAAFVLTGTFYDNLIFRKHIVYLEESDKIEFRHPVIKPDTKLFMVWIEKDLSAVAKAVYDNYESRQSELKHKHHFVSGGRITYNDMTETIEKVTGKPTSFVLQDSSGNAERDKLFRLYNKLGTTYPGYAAPDPKLLSLGVNFATFESFVRERLMPHLGLA